MQTKIKYTLGKTERLKSRKVIDELFKNGKAFSIFPFRVIYLMKNFAPSNNLPTLALLPTENINEQLTSNIVHPTPSIVHHTPHIVHRTSYIVHHTSSTPLQAGFTVSKKYFKKAVSRNRIKRLMREAYRLQKNDLQQQLLQKNIQLECFILYTGNELPTYNLVFEKMTNILKRLQKIVHENVETNK